MGKCIPALYLIIGFGLLFLLPAAESVSTNLGHVATFLIFGYWGLLAVYGLIIIVKNFFKVFGFGHLLYQLWLFVSLMCVAVGVLAILDEGAANVPWAVLMILYGSSVGYLNRSEL